MHTKYLGLLALLPIAFAGAAETRKAPPPDPTADAVMMTAGFLTWHLDLRYRLLGMEAMKKGQEADAFKFFQRAVFYADKPSQGMVAEMLWNGQGVPQDRALAYAWMDLAAERGYVGFLGLRERYWNALDAGERERALEQGREVYARYGDAAAKPRIAWKLRIGRREVTGSRTGFTSNLRIYVPGPGGYTHIDGSKFFDSRYWDPEEYQQWHDSIWQKPRIGRVSVGDVEQVGQDVPPAARSRVPETAPDPDATEPDAPEVPDSPTLGTTPPDEP